MTLPGQMLLWVVVGVPLLYCLRQVWRGIGEEERKPVGGVANEQGVKVPENIGG